MLCDIFPAPSSTEIRADWTKERRDHNVTQADTERHQPLPQPLATSHLQPVAQSIQIPSHREISDLIECQAMSLSILLDKMLSR